MPAFAGMHSVLTVIIQLLAPALGRAWISNRGTSIAVSIYRFYLLGGSLGGFVLSSVLSATFCAPC
jgi:hypothetical protein